ncbi:hypothetical protein SF293071_2379 [Shigella flexneri 2930-71]|nr:hypothetical protein SFy_3717 [Shigella flexneri 2003036]EFS12676.1 hypothetical protein SF2457T_3221 [Shigella flexneri 2a str. 2457T]EGJ86175.1 hypothetical protein SF274771_3151 [Shigella flexneri 2747-71]EGJ96761.1 hypothetical protein SF293071_2379 [Shigella flexneri 2930-71]
MSGNIGANPAEYTLTISINIQNTVSILFKSGVIITKNN